MTCLLTARIYFLPEQKKKIFLYHVIFVGMLIGMEWHKPRECLTHRIHMVFFFLLIT